MAAALRRLSLSQVSRFIAPRFLAQPATRSVPLLFKSPSYSTLRTSLLTGTGVLTGLFIRTIHMTDEGHVPVAKRKQSNSSQDSSAPSSGLPDLSSLFGNVAPVDVGFSGLLGFSAGYLANRVSQTVAFYTGIGVVSLMLLAKTGFISVHWDKMQDKMLPLLDTDGDGKVTTTDLQALAARGLNFVFGHFAHQATFVLGFALGFRYF